MSLFSRMRELKHFVQSMINEGILDHQFSQVRALHDATNPEFVAEVINSFCCDGDRIVREINMYLGVVDVSFSKMEESLHQIRGSSSTIGARRLKVVCDELLQACIDRNRDRSIRVANDVTREYCILCNKLGSVLEMEVAIFAIQRSQN
ncbi:unnamed protein product [Linum trigynum]|uniref:Histidine-containing phosphotransfer protein n=1 Tax=Linum trigynum TaxID=586398 RepID=A0AAV2FUL8_9ROSI